jgi:integrase
VSIHTLRHAAISTLIATGTHAKVVQEVAGHHSASFTLDRYGNLAATLQREAADRLDTLFGGLDKDEGTARTAG